MKNDNFIWLLNWYYKQCDSDWEHRNGIEIGTLDNPGWHLSVSLRDTECDGKKFEKIKIDRTEHDWISCFVENGIFNGFGGSFNLPEILQIFRNWLEI